MPGSPCGGSPRELPGGADADMGCPCLLYIRPKGQLGLSHARSGEFAVKGRSAWAVGAPQVCRAEMRTAGKNTPAAYGISLHKRRIQCSAALLTEAWCAA
mmetsp:Transcript_45027/g.134368  ORF Transcript_45027/g.134368 Transcript_45027/m.134368 type:complete len:100 (+) Transcript_45027:466-765(+)